MAVAAESSFSAANLVFKLYDRWGIFLMKVIRSLHTNWKLWKNKILIFKLGILEKKFFYLTTAAFEKIHLC